MKVVITNISENRKNLSLKKKRTQIVLKLLMKYFKKKKLLKMVDNERFFLKTTKNRSL